ncbi:transglutaminase domain-containing protein [Treponema sp.]|uniref:transglutaminase domain-containing protein n=1 Tax=Treponema sp. TaxID=166 RepID=UPI00388EB52E
MADSSKVKNIFSLLFRKYSAFRVFSYLFVIALVLSVISFATVKSKKVPVIDSIIPVVGSAGDTMIIRGTNFGQTRGTNYVEIGGNRITASGYINWTENLIKIVLPSNVQDGLVIVVTKSGKSSPGFFANEAGIPITVKQDTKTSLPVITSVSPAVCKPGSLLTITGSDFGTSRGTNKIYFTAAAEHSSLGTGQGELVSDFDFNTIQASETNYDYEYWSDSEIRVRVPDGAATGNIYIETEKGKSNQFFEEISTPIGSKSYNSPKTYILQINSDIDSINTKNGTNITLRFPRPVQISWQPMVELTEYSPQPIIMDYKNTIIHQLELQKSSSQAKKFKFSHTFVILTYNIQTQINENLIKPYSQSQKERVLHKNAVCQNALIQCENEKVINLAKQIVGKEVNPYKQAKLIYDYLLQNYKILNSLRKADENPLDLIKDKKGDAYDFAIFYTTLLRSIKIPAAPMAGILVDSEMKAKSHWWVEFYIEDFGWIPVDIALAMGLEYKPFRTVENLQDFYFGNLDSQHIAFSKDWNEIKQTISHNNKIVYRPKTYAFQSIWEESSEGNVNYSSLWNDPIILGLY